LRQASIGTSNIVMQGAVVQGAKVQFVAEIVCSDDKG
jgi:hypothetical protein